MQNETVTISLEKFLTYHQLYEAIKGKVTECGCMRYGEYGDLMILGENETIKEIKNLTEVKNRLIEKVSSLESSNSEYRFIAQSVGKENLGYKTAISEIEEFKKLSKWQKILKILKS